MLLIISGIPAVNVRANGDIKPSPIKQESLLILEEGTSKGEICVLGYPTLDNRTKALAREMLIASEDAELSSDRFLFDGRILSVLLKCQSKDDVRYRSVVYDAECDKILSLGDILKNDADKEALGGRIEDFVKSHTAFEDSVGEVYLDADEYDFVLSGETLGICVPPYKDKDGFLCVLPIADNELLCNAVRMGGLYPWEKAIAFTFDDGPGDYTEEILNCLEELDAKASFFVLGCHIEGSEAILERMVRLGCEVGCHGFDHKDMRKQSATAVKEEIDKTSSLIYGACGEHPTLFRAPYGEFSASVKDTALHKIKWSVDTLDWKTQSKEAVKNAILSKAQSGDIVLLHDIFKTSVEGFCEAARELSERGYKLVTVTELLELQEKEPDEMVYHKKA